MERRPGADPPLVRAVARTARRVAWGRRSEGRPPALVDGHEPRLRGCHRRRGDTRAGRNRDIRQTNCEGVMFANESGDNQTPASTSAANAGSVPAERVMRIAPLDLRQPRFKTAFRGFDRTEVVAFLTEAATDYEHALREIDRLRQDMHRMEDQLREHREREATLRNTLLTAQRLADEVKTAAQNEAKMIVREAQGRGDLLLQKAQVRLEEMERDITELRLRRRGVEGTLESSIQSLYHALEFIREQDKPDDKVLLHRPRTVEAPAAPRDIPRAADDRG